jgi:hypothetical protein
MLPEMSQPVITVHRRSPLVIVVGENLKNSPSFSLFLLDH